VEIAIYDFLRATVTTPGPKIGALRARPYVCPEMMRLLLSMLGNGPELSAEEEKRFTNEMLISVRRYARCVTLKQSLTEKLSYSGSRRITKLGSSMMKNCHTQTQDQWLPFSSEAHCVFT
jgi:hypothetical protein